MSQTELFRRIGPQRTAPTRTRSAPYEGRLKRASVPPGDSDGQWKHDLFQQGSNLYNPMVNAISSTSSLQRDHKPSPSLMPFGSFTPESQKSATTASAPPTPAANTPQSLFQRLGINNMSDAAVSQTIQTKQRNARNNRQGSSQRRADDGMDVDAAPFEPSTKTGSVVVVANLVEGTSADDVKTAFAQFGTILSAKMTNSKRVKTANGTFKNLLTAQVVFQQESEARMAVDVLHGALADGENLSVQIVRPEPPKAPRAQLAHLAAAKQKQAANELGLFSRLTGAGSGTPQVQNKAQPAAIPPPSSAMRSEQIAALDPRASLQIVPGQPATSTQWQHAETNQKRGGNRRRGGGGAQKASQNNGQLSLAQRLGMSS